MSKIPDDIRAAATFGREQALALVGMYLSMQKMRVSAGNKVSAHERRVDILPDTALINRLKAGFADLEKEAARGLAVFARANPLGRWALSVRGVGPIIAAGLLAHIDLTRAASAGAVWRFAGLDPTCKEKKRGEKRRYNAALQKLCFQFGDCLMKTAKDADVSADTALYVRLYRERKQREIARNAGGDFAGRAQAMLEKADDHGWRIGAERRKKWASGQLENMGLELRARWYAVKFFLSHYHAVGREILGYGPVEPWVIAHGGHTHYVPPPNWPMREE